MDISNQHKYDLVLMHLLTRAKHKQNQILLCEALFETLFDLSRVFHPKFFDGIRDNFNIDVEPLEFMQSDYLFTDENEALFDIIENFSIKEPLNDISQSLYLHMDRIKNIIEFLKTNEMYDEFKETHLIRTNLYILK